MRHKNETYDFRKGKRGPVRPATRKERITIRWTPTFWNISETPWSVPGGNYQTLINNALRSYIEGARQPAIEESCGELSARSCERHREGMEIVD